MAEWGILDGENRNPARRQEAEGNLSDAVKAAEKEVGTLQAIEWLADEIKMLLPD